MRLALRFRLRSLMLLILGVGLTFAALAAIFQEPPRPHEHPGLRGYLLHNESEWPVALRVEPPPSGTRYVRLRAGASLALPRKPDRVAVVFRKRQADDPDRSEDVPILDLDLRRFGSTGNDYGEISVSSRRCLTIWMNIRGDLPAD